MLLTVKSCCRILSKMLAKQRSDYTQWILFGLCVLVLQDRGEARQYLKPRVERRFMWKQMDNTMDAMKNMFGDLLPTMQAGQAQQPTSSMLEYLPSETTRVKYIIRNPPSGKPMKLIKVRSPKKIIKIMTMPNRLHGHHEHKVSSSGSSSSGSSGGDSGSSKSKLKLHMQFPSSAELRKLEKQQELIAEGRLPAKASSAGETHLYDQFEQPDHKTDIVTGKIREFGGGWTPVHESTPQQPHMFVTVKPYPVSKLHTNIATAPLSTYMDDEAFNQPPPEEEREHSQETQQLHYTFGAPMHTYEVTEYTAEESVALPQTQNYQSSRAFQPTRGTAYSVGSTSTTISTTTSTTTTEEPPNYPAAFLQKQRARERDQERERERTTPMAEAFTTHHRLKSFANLSSGNWVPVASNSSIHSTGRSSKVAPKHAALGQSAASRGKWPPQEVPAPRPFLSLAPSQAPVKAVTPELPLQSLATLRKSVKFKNGLPKTEAKSRLRGSVKFGDRVNPDELL